MGSRFSFIEIIDRLLDATPPAFPSRVRRSFPEFLEPMTASSIAKEPFNSSDWIFETKLDGYRAIAVIDSASKVPMWSRNHLPLEPKFPTIRDAV
jgi:bifunctional non-homologous end joining protein LigD